jgi:DNA-binding LacI/PurR family transcriptional regulator
VRIEEAMLRKVTINDIAKELGIANSTVSRALRDEPTISVPVRQQVKRAAALMGYVPNIAARSLRTGRSQIIGLLVRDIRDGLSPEVIPGLEAACAAHDYGLLVCAPAMTDAGALLPACSSSAGWTAS